MKHITLKVQGMECDRCSSRIDRALRATAGVAQVSVARAAATVDIDYDDTRLAESSLREAIEDLGFDVE